MTDNSDRNPPINFNQATDCLGGRFRQFELKDGKIEIRIQCNCSFKCSSRNKVFIKNIDKIPYYYVPEEFDGSELDEYIIT
jgi:hypothetical protein